jgi:hypothetical protein
MIAAAVKAAGEPQTPHRAREAARKQHERAARRPPDTAERPPDAALGDVPRPPDTPARTPDGVAAWRRGVMSRPGRPPDAAPCPGRRGAMSAKPDAENLRKLRQRLTGRAKP